MSFANLFDAKIVNKEGENDLTPCVCPQTGGAFALVVSLFAEALLWKFLCDEPSLREAIYASPNFNVDITVLSDFVGEFVMESLQLQMGFSFPFLRANNLRTSLLIMRTRSLSYVGLFLNLIANAVNNNDQHVRSGRNLRMSQNPYLRQKSMGTGIIIARRTTITLRTGQGRAARQLHRGSDASADADTDAEV